ncbi:MAG: DUF4262 domain-containing protein [Thermodesulfovibrionales bacterium]
MKQDKVLQKVQDDITKYGLSVITVPGDANSPTISYSIGLWRSYNHPEIITFGLPPQVALIIINDIGERIKKGTRFKDGDRAEKLSNFPMAFVQVPKDRFEGNLNVALAYYEHSEFGVLQLVWPDKQGKFPWETGFQEELRKSQPILARLS